MSNEVSAHKDTQRNMFNSGQTTFLNFCEFSSEHDALNLVKEQSTDIQKAWTQIPSGAKRDATEGCRLPGRMATTSGLQQTTIGKDGAVLERTRKSINITDVADKFLLGTMKAESQLEGSSLGFALPEETGGMWPKNTEHAIEYSGNLPSGLNSFNTISGGEQLHCQQKKAKSSHRPSRPPLLPPCRICGDRASGYHYGVNTCEACKGFFRRSICKTEPYVCTGTGDCKTFGGKRTSCSHCRFQRCLAMGMSKNAIKTGRYTHELRSKNILEVKRLQKQESEESSEHSLEQMSNFDLNSTEYKMDLLEETLGVLVTGQTFLNEFLDDYYNDDLIRQRQHSVYMDFMKRKRELFEQEEIQAAQSERHNAGTENSAKLVPGCVQSQNGNQDMPLDMCYSENEVLNKRTERDVGGIGDVRYENQKLNGQTGVIFGVASEKTDLCVYQSKENDNAHDIRKEAIAPLRPGEAIISQREKLRADVLEKIINDMEQGVQGMLAFAKCLPGFTELPTPDQASLLKAARFDIWYIGHIRCFNVELRVGACEWEFHAEELAQVWGDSMVDLAFTLSRLAQGLDLTKEETAALRAVCLTFPDRCTDLQKRDEVEQMHAHMLDVFKFVSCKRHSNYNKWFSKVINFLVMLREFGIKFESISTKLKLDWSVLKDNPLLLSVFLS